MKELTKKDLLPCKNCGEKDFSIGVTVLYAFDGPYDFIGSVQCYNCERVEVTVSGEHRKAATQAAMRAWNQEQEATK